MSTTNVSITPADGWKSVFTGPTDKPLSVEKNTGSSQAWLAISGSLPELDFGHGISNGELKNVSLADGESLFIKCNDGLSQNAVNVFSITP